MIDLKTLKSVYFIGIGGVSMSSLAMILKSMGIDVSGYDANESDNTKMLEQNGIRVDKEFIPSAFTGIYAVVYTAAIKEDDPMLQYAHKLKIPTFTRAELLGAVTSMYKYSVGVSGTHGKSTTTGMLAEIFMQYDKDCAILSGAVLPKLSSLYKTGNGERVVFEACEYKDSFLSMMPNIKVVLNCKHDHVDYFPTLEDVKNSFTKYMDADFGKGNISVVNYDCENARESAEKSKSEIYYYSAEKETDFYAKNITCKNGRYSFDIVFPNKQSIRICLKVIGMHNLSNSLAAAGAAYLSKVPLEFIKSGLEEFSGVARRFEFLGSENDVDYVDDYAHHPDEIEVTLNSARKLGYERIICVFQPHTFSRTKALMPEFAKALSIADNVILLPIYAAREKNTENISSENLAKMIPNSECAQDFDDAVKRIYSFIKKGDLVITMGAGEAYKCARIILDK